MLREPWRAELLGRITLRSGGEVYDRFRERKMVALFALLSLQGKRFLTRNELVERLWPDEAPDISRNRFRVTLHHLKHLLEPVGVAPGTVLQTGRDEVYLQPAAFTSDVNDLAVLLDTADKSADAGERTTLREQAVALYRGEFLPGYEDEWVEQEREALARRHFHALRGLSRDLLTLKEPARGLVWARRAVGLEPLEEEAHFDLMRLYALGGQASEALRHYEQFQVLLLRELNAQPSLATQKLAALLQTHLGHEVKTSASSPASAAVSSELPAEPPVSAAASSSAASAAPLSFSSPINAARPRPALPMRLTRFFGREQDIAALCALLAPASDGDNAPTNEESDFAVTRLVTLAGPGGMGKTRLALEVGDRLQAAYAGRVYFVGMEDAVSPHQLGEALQNALGLPPSEKTDAVSQALAVLTQSPCLLILDNLEHLLPEISASVLHLLTNAPDLRCLVTSRRSVGLEGEREYALGPLALPEPDAVPASLRDYAGVALFLDRARARRADFALTAQNGPDILRLCRLLEGMPLALELAAARVRVMSAHEMCAQFTQALEWLVDARGGKEARHRSLRAAITWSHRMLTPSARRCWHLCSVFAGGFTSDMAVWMCAPILDAPANVLLALEELCAASLLTGREDAQGDTRFAMLESLRVFAGEQREQSEQSLQASARHLEWFARRVEAASAYQNTSQNPGRNTDGEKAGREPAYADAPRIQERQAEEAYFAWTEKEAANLRAALTHGLSERAGPAEQEQAVGLAANLADHWRAQGRLTEGRDWLRQALALPVPNRVKIMAQIAAARLAAQQADYEEAHTLATLAAQAAHDANDTQNVANSRYLMGIAAFHQGHYPTAETHLEVALGLYAAPNDDSRRADCLNSLGMAAWYQGDHASARLYVEGALYIQRARNSQRGVANCLQRLGNIVRDRGDLDGGETLLQEALQTFHGLPDAVGIASCLHDLGVIANFRGDHAQAQGRFYEARSRFQACGLRHGYSSCLHNLGQIELNAERWEAGRVLMREALDIHRQLGDRRSAAAALHNLAYASRGAGRLDEARGLLLEALTMDREMGSPISVSQHLHSLGRVYAALGEMPQAFAALREATAIIRTVDGRADLASILRTWALLLTDAGQARLAVRIRGATTAYLRTVDFAIAPGEQREDDRALSVLRAALGEPAFAECWQQGENLSLEQAADEIEGAEAEQM